MAAIYVAWPWYDTHEGSNGLSSLLVVDAALFRGEPSDQRSFPRIGTDHTTAASRAPSYALDVRFAGWLDRVLYRHPFEGASARRYASAERPAFGPLDQRLLEGMPQLATARRLLDVGFGPGTFASAAVARHPHLNVIAIDPSRDFARSHAGIGVVRAGGEALPIASEAIDVAICLSSIRHVRDRAATLGELRRVVRPGGTLVIVELDPEASATRIAAHAEGLGRAAGNVRGSQVMRATGGGMRSTMLRRAFGPLVVRTAPASEVIVKLATHAGWVVRALRDDPVQPVYVMELA